MNQSALFVGAGNMGGAIIKGYLSSGGDAEDVSVVDPYVSDNIRKALNGVQFYSDFDSLPDDTGYDAVVLATKPQIFQSVSPGIAATMAPDGVVISIMAGISTEAIATSIGGDVPVVRCMPNIAASKGVSANVAFTCDYSKKTAFERLFQGSGAVRWVSEEDDLHLTTAISGSGPAYFFAFVEALAASGAKSGLDPQMSMELAIDTMIGASELLKSGRNPAELRESVTSKGGTTAAALATFVQDGNLQEVVDDAVSAAIARSKELGS